MNKTMTLFALLFWGIVAPLLAVELKPVSVEQGFVEPGQTAILRFTIDGGVLASSEYRLCDAWGKPVKIEKAAVNGNTLTVSVDQLSQGFWELEFPATQQRFGITVLPAFRGNPDSFFAIDAALSWLVHDDAIREGLVKAAKRSGIGMIRERVTWSSIEPSEHVWNWEGDRHYEKIRKICKENGIEVLELFHGAPAWTGWVEKYPDDLIKMAAAWETIAQRWASMWGALEIWNEPDISFGAYLPADQYVPMIKAMTYRLKQSGIPTPIFGGVIALFEQDWLDTAAQNGLLDAVDGFSFHTYCHAPSLENLITQYRVFLTRHSKATMPLWLTECGRPWKKGAKRPEITEDWISAVDITMKGVESRCCGIERYFPFVYPYYEEGGNNFGMMDSFGTPTRAFAAYAYSILTLAGSEYIGDLKLDNPDILRARAFAKGNDVILVLYTGEIKGQKKITVSGNILGLFHATGEEIKMENGIPLTSNSMMYVRLQRQSIESSLNRETAAMELYRPSRERYSAVPHLPPIVLRYQFDKERVTAMPLGYAIRPTEEKTLPITIRAYNLQSKPTHSSLRLLFDGSPMEQQSITIPAQGYIDTTWSLSLDRAKLFSGDFIPVRVDVEDIKDALTFSLCGEPKWEGVRASVGRMTEIPIGDLKHWTKSAPANCTMSMEKPLPEEQAVWRMFASFGEGDRWVYPRFEIPESINLETGDGIILWARCIGDAKPGFMLFDQGVSGYLVQPAIKSDGEWHVVKLPFERFGYVSATPPDPNGTLDPDQVRVFSFGANPNGMNCVLELKKVALYSDKP